MFSFTRLCTYVAEGVCVLFHKALYLRSRWCVCSLSQGSVLTSEGVCVLFHKALYLQQRMCVFSFIQGVVYIHLLKWRVFPFL